jgi:uncharacterized protein YkwD
MISETSHIEVRNGIYMTVLQKTFLFFSLFAASVPVFSVQAATASMQDRVDGYILLQVESHGEAWYVDPVTHKRYYMKDGPTAYEMMRTFGLGMTESDYEKLANGDQTLAQRLRGRIVLRVEQHGEAYYLHPNGKIFYLANGSAAYQIMRQESLGITNSDLAFVPKADLLLKPSSSVTSSSNQGSVEVEIHASQYQAGAEPAAFSGVDLNTAWLNMINAERRNRGLQTLEVSQNLIDATASWAAYLGSNQVFTHTRPDGGGLLTWGHIFLPDASAFGENLASVAAADSAEGMQAILDQAMALFMAEEPDNGPHFQNIVNASWQSTAVGVYFVPATMGGYQTYAVFQFADTK